MKRSRVDWKNIKITIVPVDKDNLTHNPLNPCSKMNNKEREKEILSISAKIWARAIKEKLLKEKADKYIDLVEKCNIIPTDGSAGK